MVSSLYVAERGAGPKTVVLLHGFGGCHDIWREVTATLAPGIRTLAYDLPGHGLSLDFPGSGPAKTAARAVLADLAARGIARVHVAGHSMGGAVATLMALAEPETIASLTLLAPGGFGPEINGPLLRRYAAARIFGIVGVAGTILGIATGLVAAVLMGALSGGPSMLGLAIPWPSIVLAAVLGIGVSILAAWYPARLASQLAIVRAVQHE